MGKTPETVVRAFQEAMAHDAAGRLEAALACLERALGLAPDHPDVLAALGDLQRRRQAFPAARAACERALELAPGHGFARLTMARTLRDAGAAAEAETAYRRFLHTWPKEVPAWFELGHLLFLQERFEEALAALDRALQGAPGQSLLHLHHGLIHFNLMHLEEAVAAFDRGLALEPPGTSRDLMAWNRTLARLLLGHLDDEAWAARELRLPLSEVVPRTFARPAWDGSALAGRTVLLHGTNEGLGDSIMGLRYAALVRERGGRVLVECAPGLLEVARTCPGVDEAVAAGAELPPYDVHAHLMSLPRLFRTRPETIPGREPYLFLPAPDRIPHREAIAELTRPEPGRFNVGLVYAGLTCQAHPLAPAELAPLAAGLDRVRFFSLQQHREPPLEALPGVLEAVDLGGLLADCADTAWALSRLDLVISVDTSVLHLAGALGRPAAALIPFAPDWRWLARGTRSLWYPTLRLYRQPAPRDWGPALAAVLEDLQRLPACGNAALRGLDGLLHTR